MPETSAQAHEDAEKQRKNELKNHRRFRTVAKKALEREMDSIQNLRSETPVFTSDGGPDESIRRIRGYATSIREHNAAICSLIEDDAEWDAEALVCEQLYCLTVDAVAAVEAASHRLRRSSGAPESGSSDAASTESNLDNVPRQSTAQQNVPATSPGIQFERIDLAARPSVNSNLNEVPAIRVNREYDMTPRIFSGDRLQFRTFVAEFEEYVGHRKDVSSLRKLIILRKFLHGEPSLIVDALELTEANYQVALSLLEKNYSRVGSEKSRIISELRNLPVVSKPFDYAAISNLVTTVQRHISILAVNGVTLSEIALTLLDSMQAALPTRVRQEFRDQQKADERYGAQNPSVNTASASASTTTSTAGAAAATEVECLISFLRQRLRDIEHLKQDKCPTSSADKKFSRSHRRNSNDSEHHPQSTVAAVARRVPKRGVKQQTGRQFEPRQCLFCKASEHSSSRCNANLTATRRIEILRSLKRCVKCFRTNHAVPSECQGPRSACAVCDTKEHYTSVHPDAPAAPPVANGTITAMVSQDSVIRDALLMTASAYVVNRGRRIPTRIFVDPGSTMTIATPELCRRIQERPLGRCNLSVQAFASTHARQGVPVIPIRLVGSKGGKEIVLEACEHELGVNPPNFAPAHVMDAIRRFNERFPVADRSYVGEWQTEPPAILLGMDQLQKLMIDAKPETVLRDIKGLKSHFGWIIGGPVPKCERNPKSIVQALNLVCCAATAAAIHRQDPITKPAKSLERLWNLESIGVVEPVSTTNMTADEASAMAQFHASLVYVDGYYSVGIPKRPSIVSLPNNHAAAAHRLERKLSQLQRDPKRYERYHQELMKFVEKGYAVEIVNPALTVATTNDGCYYMPHHEVVTTRNSAEKWRIVFDCSAKARGASSLNDHLLPGPNLNADLVTLLLNFRLHRVAVSADVTQAYMRIGLAAEDQRYFRFLWTPPGEGEIRTFQMQRVTWGAAPSGFLLAAVLREHFRTTSADAEKKFSPQFYADDYLASYQDVKEAIAATDLLRQTLKSANMELAKWKTSSEVVRRHLTTNGVPEVAFDMGNAGLFNILGLVWVTTEDRFRFELPNLPARLRPDQPNTKREALSVIASFFDPLGWALPFSLRGRKILQEIWSAGLEWSQTITPDIQNELETWANESTLFNEFSLPRRFSPCAKTPTSRRLHVFGDASPQAFAAVAYLETRYEDGAKAFSLVMCRARLAPLESQTLPRLELLAALTAVRLKAFLVERMAIDFEEIRFYTDSRIAFHWVTSANPGSWKTFVFNRVKEIQNGSSAEQWYHVRGECNIADLATRGVAASDLIKNSEWWNGPSWLHLPEERQPITQPRSAGAETWQPVQDEIKKVTAPIVPREDVIDIERYSSLGRALRVMINVLRFINNCRQNISDPQDIYERAETLLIAATQAQFFQEEITLTKAGQRPPSVSKLAAFSLIFERGLLRAKTRLTEGTLLSYDEQNPIVLPGESRLAKLFILDAHRINAHFGVATVLSHMRRRFWVTRGRQVIKALLSRCVVCRKRQSRPGQQIEAPLPSVRVDLQEPFRACGFDFCGPFYTRHWDRSEKASALKKTDTSRKKVKKMYVTVKTYIAVFSCTTTRSVHFEAVPSLTTPQTLLAIRRFLAIYPACRQFISDNGTQLVKAAGDIQQLFRSRFDREVSELLESRRISWEFNCPAAAHRGGIFERVLSIAKLALSKTLGKSLIGYEEFRTILWELSAVINSRPLTYVSEDPDSPSPITPAYFLRGGPHSAPIASLAPVDKLASDEVASADEVRTAVRHRTTYFKNLSVRWYREYLLLLRGANATRGSATKPIAIGDVCLLRDDNQPRIKWKLVRIIGQHPGRDGKVRTYSIRLANGHETRRAVQHLYPLEIQENQNTTSNGQQ